MHETIRSQTVHEGEKDLAQKRIENKMEKPFYINNIQTCVYARQNKNGVQY